MKTECFALPILPGKSEEWRRFLQEIAGPRRAEYEVARRDVGIIAERIWLTQTTHSTSAIICITGNAPSEALAAVATSASPFNRWYREQIHILCGIDLTRSQTRIPNELVLEWRASRAGDSPNDH